ncbi:MAG: hypothetical protein V4640_13605 [Verrucomicrobiota bacterium]
MTDKEKLQQLFSAALQDGSRLDKPLTRAFPESKVACAAVPKKPEAAPVAVVVETAAIPAVAPERQLVEPLPNAGLDEATSAELGKLLDAQLARVSSRRKKEMLVTMAVVIGLVGGGIGWFVHSPARVVAFTSAMSEMRSLTDIKGTLAKYQVALDKVGTRGKEIENSSAALGVDPATVQDEDPYLEAETEQFTGEEGTGVGARNQKLQEKMGDLVKSPLVSGQSAPVANQ